MTASRAPRIARPTQARNTNTAAVLRQLVDAPAARAELVRVLGLDQSTVTRIVATLLRAGLIRETGVPGDQAAAGRPRVPLELAADARYAVGLHFGKRWTTVGLTDLRGRCVTSLVQERDPSDARATVRDGATLVDRVLAQAPGPVIGVGVGTGGWVDSDAGVVHDNSVLGWHEVPLRALLAERLGRPIVIDSHVRAQTRAELLFGAARSAADVAYLFVGNVVEMGLAMDGDVRVGTHAAGGSMADLVVPAPEGGYVRLGDAATDSAVLERAQRAGLLAAGDRLDDRAEAPLRDRAHLIAGAVAQLLGLLDPELVVLGGGALIVPAHLDYVREVVARTVAVDPDRIVASDIGPQPLVTAAAATLLDAYYTDPIEWETPQ